MDRGWEPLARSCAALRERSCAALLPALAALLLLLASCVALPPETPSAAAPPAPTRPAAAPSAQRNRVPIQPAPTLVPGAEPHVALLLPLTGRQAAAAATIRDGFLTAYCVSPSSVRPRVRVYDTDPRSVAEAMDGAVRAGALFIVGPLTREEVAAAAQLPAPHPPILALNFLPAGAESPGDFYQFALSPEDEARDVARRILADGHRRGVVVAPDGEWGSRVLAAFGEELTAGGGLLLAAARFDPLATSYEPAITDVLRIDESTERFKRLETIVGGKLEFQPRRRGDIDFIFAPSSAATARLLTPQLKYFFAGNLPTYATSEAYEPNPTADEDLEGLMFPIMPWLLGSGLTDSVRLAASSAWPADGPRRDQLFAFGFDAYRLMMALRAAPASASDQARNAGSISLEGLTGQLTIDPSGRVHRGLDWAQVHNGEPRALPPTQPEQNPAAGQNPAPGQNPSGGQAPAAPAAAPSPSTPAPSPSPPAAPPGR
jgi:uncharacterized protein